MISGDSPPRMKLGHVGSFAVLQAEEYGIRCTVGAPTRMLSNPADGDRPAEDQSQHDGCGTSRLRSDEAGTDDPGNSVAKRKASAVDNSSTAEGSQGSTAGRRRRHAIPYKGVYKCSMTGGQFWQAQISIDGTTYHLGVFEDMEDAARAYDAQARLLGRRVNFPDDPGSPSSAPTPKMEQVKPFHLDWSPAACNDLDDQKRAAFWHGSLAPLTVSPSGHPAPGFGPTVFAHAPVQSPAMAPPPPHMPAGQLPRVAVGLPARLPLPRTGPMSGPVQCTGAVARPMTPQWALPAASGFHGSQSTMRAQGQGPSPAPSVALPPVACGVPSRSVVQATEVQHGESIYGVPLGLHHTEENASLGEAGPLSGAPGQAAPASFTTATRT